MGTYKDAHERVDSYHICLRGVTSLMEHTVRSRLVQTGYTGMVPTD
jgi:hypothetical protein